ncbi:GNAT family N-acetyltransferase [Streptomyces rochei]
MHPEVWGQGVGTEIGRSLLSLGFDRWGLHRIHATFDLRGTAVDAVARPSLCHRPRQ